MTRRISLITAVAGLALVLVPAGWGKGQPVDVWNYDESGQQVADTSPGLTSQELASLYSGEGSVVVAPIGSPERADRAAAARLHEQTAMLDARERSFQAGQGGSHVSAIDARERAFDAKLQVQRSAPPTRVIHEPVRDDRFRLDSSSVPGTTTTTGSGRELEWPQVGIGVGLAAVLLLGLLLAVRISRTRPLAH